MKKSYIKPSFIHKDVNLFGYLTMGAVSANTESLKKGTAIPANSFANDANDVVGAKMRNSIWEVDSDEDLY